MDQKAADELIGRQPHDLVALSALGSVVLPLESGGLSVGADQAAVGNGDLVRVPAKIGEHGLWSAKGLFSVNHPFGSAQRREMGGERVWVRQFQQITKEVQFARLMQSDQTFQE